MTRSTMREHIFKLLFRAPFIDNKDEYEEQINLYFADADMVDACLLYTSYRWDYTGGYGYT